MDAAKVANLDFDTAKHVFIGGLGLDGNCALVTKDRPLFYRWCRDVYEKHGSALKTLNLVRVLREMN